MHLSESSGPITIALDSTGVKVEKAGGWVERKHGKKKRYVKLHFAVNTMTHEVMSMEVSTDDVHDSKVAASLVEGPVVGRRWRRGLVTVLMIPRRSMRNLRSVV
jgi:hypothetical protein